MKSFVKAYLDGYREITVVINRTFCGGRSDVFYLVRDNDYAAMTVHSVEELPDKVVYHVVSDREIEIGAEYEVMIVNACKIQLEYRFIVKTPRFNEEFFYAGNDLGCVNDDRFTSFALWSPTANQVKIELEHDGKVRILAMQRTDKGVWRLKVTPSVTGAIYRYLVRINGEWSYCVDPYAKASCPNSEKSIVVDCLCPETDRKALPPINKYSDAIIYEASIRDISRQGTFESGLAYLDYLKDLGITHLQLMPVNDFGSVDELHPFLFYNWGYDPVQYQVLEGSYSSNVTDGQQVRRDFADFVRKAHEYGIRINLDVVFNHVHVFENSCFQLSVPYYFFRYFPDGRLSDGSGCGNDFDTQMVMARKYILDTLKYYVECFDVDGFRFDLMGLLDITIIKEACRQLKELKPDIMIYGEGWNMNTPLAFEDKACKENQAILPEVAFFNDYFRDSIKGHTFDAKAKGYGTGDITKISDAINVLAGKTYSSPEQSVNYVECHDDMTCFDKLHFCCPDDSEEQLVERQKLLLGCVLLAKGISFIHAGQEYCRSKNFLSNTYNAGDAVNKLKLEDREKYADVIAYVRKMIAIRKKLNLDELTLSSEGGVIIGKTGKHVFLINPMDKTVSWSFKGIMRDMMHEGAEYTEVLKMAPVSITVLEEIQK